LDGFHLNGTGLILIPDGQSELKDMKCDLVVSGVEKKAYAAHMIFNT